MALTTLADSRAFARKMLRHEIAQCRKYRAANRLDRAQMALVRARLWRQQERRAGAT